VIHNETNIKSIVSPILNIRTYQAQYHLHKAIGRLAYPLASGYIYREACLYHVFEKRVDYTGPRAEGTFLRDCKEQAALQCIDV
jgi:hypothetical protein